MPWQPLLEGTLKDRAWESVQAILDDLTPLAQDLAGDPSLGGGTIGLALLHGYGYLAQARGGPEPVARAQECLRCATEVMMTNPTPASLYRGLTGLGWALAHLQDRLPGLDG